MSDAADGVTLLAIYDRLGSVDAKLEALSAQTRERLDHGDRTIEDHEKRLRLMEAALPEHLGDRLGELEAAGHRRRGSVGVIGLAFSALGSSSAGALITLLITYLLTRR